MKPIFLPVFALCLTGYAAAGSAENIYVCFDEKTNKKVLQSTPCGALATAKVVSSPATQGNDRPGSENVSIYGNTIRPDVAKRMSEDAREDRVRDAIRASKAIRGMTEDEVISSLGRPDKINNNGGREQWVYYKNKTDGTTYVYFENGRVR